MPIIWVYGNHYDIWELLTSIAYASENLKTFADLSGCSDRRSSLVYAVTWFSFAKKIPWLTYAHNLGIW